MALGHYMRENRLSPRELPRRKAPYDNGKQDDAAQQCEAKLWGAVCKNIISDRFSTKTAISGRDSYLCMQRCYLWQR